MTNVLYDALVVKKRAGCGSYRVLCILLAEARDGLHAALSGALI